MRRVWPKSIRIDLFTAPPRPLRLPSRLPFLPVSSRRHIMTKESTPPPTESTTNNATHQPPSLPTSPLAKRQKQEQPPTTMSSAGALPPLFIKKLTDAAKPPTRGSAFAAGYDLYSAKETIIPARGKALVDTGIAIAVPVGTCMFLSDLV